jgi:hypothetical protein
MPGSASRTAVGSQSADSCRSPGGRVLRAGCGA